MAMELGELQRSFEESKLIGERQEARVNYHETKVQNIAVAYLIWGRLFFFAISQSSSSLNCNDWWVAFALSVLCTFVYLVFFLDAVVMLHRTQHRLDAIHSEQTEIYRQILAAKHQANVGLSTKAGDSRDGFGFSFHKTMLMKSEPLRIVERKVYIYPTVFALLAVAAIELYACKFLLCN